LAERAARRIGYQSEEEQETQIELPIGSVETLPSATVETQKSGWYSSEFIVTATVVAAIVVLMLFDKVTVADIERLWPVFVSTGAYALSRGIAKGRK
jgi:hypothetical protein